MRIINNNNEITKCDEKLDEKIEKFRQLTEVAAEQGTITIDGVTYDSVFIWRMLAKEALDIAEQQEWFEIHED
ncbi:hypothetical protein [Lactobacillus crispatus]|uniref:Uncharacterized protein n=1 Tax=Lactobacillus crispatus TaxID=47770 RepID=A0A7H9EA99_9LACO|nr:hypothetical protein [Lactobacillus crispatus]QLL74594.1 hypothetical protein GTO85_09670 [Lactobacillus crispatus]